MTYLCIRAYSKIDLEISYEKCYNSSKLNYSKMNQKEGIAIMNMSMEFARKMLQAYGTRCQSLCQELHIPQTAFDILMFLANNPECSTARDIVEIRGIKANLVSVNVNKLVQDGYLNRQSVAGDRRKIRLAVTERAQPIIGRGRQLQTAFLEDIFRGVEEQAREDFFRTIRAIRRNLDQIVKESE